MLLTDYYPILQNMQLELRIVVQVQNMNLQKMSESNLTVQEAN
jgi:hypothetical protein